MVSFKDEFEKFYLYNQVLHKENGFCYPIRSLLHKCFGRKKNTSDNYASTSEVKFAENHDETSGTDFIKDVSGPILEAMSLEMKQQELDGR